MIAQTDKTYYTPQEYLALEENSESRSEYRNGEITLMAGGTTNHNQIIANIYFNLRSGIRGNNNKIYTENVRLWIEKYHIYTYPDVMVTEGEPVYYGLNTTTITNPRIIFEVTSKSTKNYDQGDKFDYYRSLPQFQEYILIEQSKYHVMQYSKNSDSKWLLSEYDSPEAVLALTSLSTAIALKDLYEGVDFELKED